MKATIDRIEGDLAVLILRDNNTVKFNLPIIILQGMREGDMVDITITKDEISTKATKERVTSLIEKLKRLLHNSKKLTQ
jgi:hypothetical protein